MLIRNKYLYIIMAIPIKPKANGINRQTIFKLFNVYKNPQVKCLFAISYLAGLRIQEALAIRRKDFTIDRLEKDGSIYNIVVLHAINKKSRINPYKDIPLITFTPEEKTMLEYVLAYKDKWMYDQLIFRMNRQNAYDQLTKETVLAKMYSFQRRCKQCNEVLYRSNNVYVCHVHGVLDNKSIIYIRKDYEAMYRFNPHYARHNRAEHLSEMFDTNDLMNYFGWSTPVSATYYIKKNWKRTALKMLAHSV
jgi:hypothetical protein